MNIPWAFQGIKRFPGLWTNEAGHVLFIEIVPDTENLYVSFSPSKQSPPVSRIFFDDKPSVQMPGIWREDLGEVVVDLGKEGHEPWLHLAPEYSDFYFEGPCLVPSISMKDHNKPPDFSWLEPLKPYWLVDPDEWEDFYLVRYLVNHEREETDCI